MNHFPVHLVIRAALIGTFALSIPDLSAQTMTVPQVLEQRSSWSQWASDGTKLIIDGRFEGRAGSSFRLQELDFLITPPRSLSLPDRMQAGQRLEISGRLKESGGNYTLDVTRLTVGETDLKQLEDRAQRIPGDQPQLLVNLAAEFEPIADFYQDQSLAEGISRIRRQAFRGLRKQLSGQPDALWALIKTGEQLGASDDAVNAVMFESLVARYRAPQSDLKKVCALIRLNLPGWDVPAADRDAAISNDFQNDPVSVYDAATESRRRNLHRDFYRLVRRDEIRRQLNPDGSNGLELAMTVRNELPEENGLAVDLERQGIDFRLSQAETLNRNELQTLCDLLLNYQRSADIRDVVDRWIKEQERRYGRLGLSGTLRTADEYQFVGERWQRPEYVEKAVGLLKEAWQAASEQSPQDAVQIADRLRLLGWERMQDKWMTMEQIQHLPKDDIQIAIREGRVVVGMDPEQVMRTLGKPGRVSRIVSAVAVHELWMYAEGGGNTIVVALKRSPKSSQDSARVISVSGASDPTRTGRRR